jgi:hypothetical protein
MLSCLLDIPANPMNRIAGSGNNAENCSRNDEERDSEILFAFLCLRFHTFFFVPGL